VSICRKKRGKVESVQGNRTVNAKKEMIMFSASDEKKDIQDSGKKEKKHAGDTFKSHPELVMYLSTMIL